MKMRLLGMAVACCGMALFTGQLRAAEWHCGFERNEGYEQPDALPIQPWESDQLALALSSEAAKGEQSLALSGDGWLTHAGIETTGTRLTHLALKPSVTENANESTLLLLDGSIIGFAPNGEQAEVMVPTILEGKDFWLPTDHTFDPTNWLTLTIVQDASDKTWELYAGAELVADRLPLASENTPPGLTLLPGSNGTVLLDNIRQQSGTDLSLETFLTQAALADRSTTETLLTTADNRASSDSSSETLTTRANPPSTLTLSARSPLLKNFAPSDLEVFSPLRERQVILHLNQEN